MLIGLQIRELFIFTLGFFFAALGQFSILLAYKGIDSSYSSLQLVFTVVRGVKLHEFPGDFIGLDQHEVLGAFISHHDHARGIFFELCEQTFKFS